jgi:hypothetical protein
MRLNVQSFHLTGMLADWIVIPRSRSAGRKSVVVLPVSTEPGVDMNDDLRRMDSVRVVFPESTKNEYRRQGERVPSFPPICAQIARLRSFEACAWLCAMDLTEAFLAVMHAT